MALWSALGSFHGAQPARHHDRLCLHSMLHNGVVSGDLGQHLAPAQGNAPGAHRISRTPRLPLPIEQPDCSLQVEPPALIKGYLRLGSKVLGPPAWDPDFNSADLP